MLPLLDYRAQLDQIVGVSPYNVRQGDADDDLSSLKATILAAGLINPIVCHFGEGLNELLVLAGRRRWLAICELVKENENLYFAGLDIKVTPAETRPADLIALSTMENTTPRPMHAVREYEAFAAIAAAMPNQDAAVEAIAREFGLTRKIVRQRLALGALSPKIRAAWLADDIDAEAARAYAECPDIAAQEAFFDANQDSWRANDGWNIRKALLSDLIDGDDPLAVFVGDDAYRAAGGQIRESLFAEERRFSGPLLKKLARDKLQYEGDGLLLTEGWGFVVLSGDEAPGAGYAPSNTVPDFLGAELARRGEIEDRIEEIQNDGTFAASGEAAIELDALLAEFDAITSKGFTRALTKAQRKALGILVGVDDDGRLEVSRAIRRTAQSDAAPIDEDETDEDAKAPGPLPSPRVGEGSGTAPDSGAPTPEEPLGKQLRTVLDETIGPALHDAASRSVNLALAIAVARLGAAVWSGSVIDLRIHTRRGWTAKHPLLRALDRLDFEPALKQCVAAPLADLTAAFCELVGASIDPSRADSLAPALGLVAAAAPLAAIESDLKRHFEPQDYFRAATKDAAIAAVRELQGEASAAEARAMKKPQLVEHASLVAKDFDWLPKSLRDILPVAEASASGRRTPERAAEDAPSPNPGEGRPQAEPDERTTAEAMRDAIEADEATEDQPVNAHIGDFILTECAKGEREDVKASILLGAYNVWAQRRNHPQATQGQLATALKGFGYEKHRYAEGVFYLGLTLANQAEEAAQ